MPDNRIHAPALSVPLQGMSFGDLGDSARAVTPANPMPAYSPGGLLAVTGGFARPADTSTYAVGDLVANSTTAGSVAAVELTGAVRGAGEAIRIERVRLRKSGPVLTQASFRIHLFRKPPVVSVGDNSAFNVAGVLALSDIEGHVGSADVTLDLAAAAGAKGVGLPSAGTGITCDPSGGTGHETSLWALIEARAAYAPVTGETFHVTVEGARS